MDKKDVDILLKIILQKNLSILILDTCSLLDVVRCIQRARISDLKSALNIFDDWKKTQEKCLIVFPSLFEKEWSDNIETVKKETRKAIETTYNAVECYNYFFQPEIEKSKFISYSLENKLLDLSNDIINSTGIIVKKIEECVPRATDRVINSIPPAKKGKDSTKDCIIFEEVLFISNNLRNNGFDKKIVFVTSNTKEYYINNSLIPEIDHDLKLYDIDIATSLNHAYNVIST